MEKNKPVGDKANKRHKAFAEEYLANGMNGTQAYKKVYPKASDDTARANATKLLADAHIQAFLDTKKTETSTKLEITKESLIIALNGILMDDSAKHNDRINSIKVMNQMLGFNEATKVDNTHTLNTSIKDLMGFDDE